MSNTLASSTASFSRSPGHPGSAGEAAPSADLLGQYLDDCRQLVLQEIEAMMPKVRHGQRLYDLMLEYPLRGGKALRPALCVATCRALGGHYQAVLRSAAAIELYHNAFLVHDDVEDKSELRRTEPTLHRKYGVPIAVNVGDGMLALSMQSLMGNTTTIGLGRTLRVLQTVVHMARESAEGQMMELGWVTSGAWALTDRAYIRMVYKKTTWYSFITPVFVGAIAAGVLSDRLSPFARFATPLGVAFQIQDDVLNLVASADEYGKEIGGDLWEGKHTLMLIHAVRQAAAAERARASEILQKSRPSDNIGALGVEEVGRYRTQDDIDFLKNLIDRYDGVGYARAVAARHAARAARSFQRIEPMLTPSSHTDFLRGLVEFVVGRAS